MCCYICSPVCRTSPWLSSLCRRSLCRASPGTRTCASGCVCGGVASPPASSPAPGSELCRRRRGFRPLKLRQRSACRLRQDGQRWRLPSWHLPPTVQTKLSLLIVYRRFGGWAASPPSVRRPQPGASGAAAGGSWVVNYGLRAGHGPGPSVVLSVLRGAECGYNTRRGAGLRHGADRHV